MCTCEWFGLQFQVTRNACWFVDRKCIIMLYQKFDTHFYVSVAQKAMLLFEMMQYPILSYVLNVGNRLECDNYMNNN